MIVAQEIDKLLTAHAPAGLCNACIADLLKLTDVHAIELRTTALALTPYFERLPGTCARCGKATIICMPTGAKGRKHAVDVIGDAVKVMRIAAGEEQEEFVRGDGKDPAAKALGREHGAERRAEIARKVAEKRWESRSSR